MKKCRVNKTCRGTEAKWLYKLELSEGKYVPVFEEYIETKYKRLPKGAMLCCDLCKFAIEQSFQDLYKQ